MVTQSSQKKLVANTSAFQTAYVHHNRPQLPTHVHTSNTAQLSLCMQTLCEETKGDAIITTGVGQHQMWAAQWYKYNEPRRWASSGGLGSMGFGLPSALGAAVAWDGTDSGRPKKVIAS